MIKRITLIIAALALSWAASAQAFGEIHGTIIDENDKPMGLAEVYVKAGEATIGTQSDFDGDFKIKPLNSGTYTVYCSFMGYHDYKMYEVVVKPDKITFVGELKMTPTSVALKAAEKVYYERPLMDIDNTGMTGLTAEEIEKMPEKKDIVKFIGKTTAGVTMSPDGSELYFRGSRGGANLYMIDGMKIIGTIPNIPSSGIGSLSVYTGGVPAKYGDFTGGVIVIETKNFFDTYNKKKFAEKEL